MEQAVEKLLVAVNEGIQFMGQGKDRMKVGGINDFGPAFIHPDFLEYRLTAGTVTVTAGIIMEFDVPAAAAPAGITAKFSRLAV